MQPFTCRRPADSASARPRCEALESRRLLSGDLDPSFGGDGTVTMDVPGSQSDTAVAVAVQNDGKVVVAAVSAGHPAVLRYLPNGSLDPSFGTGGVVPLSFGRSYEDLRDVAVDGLGRIVLAGALADAVSLPGGDFAVVRLLPGGALDSSFDGDGLALVDFGGTSDGASALSLRADNSIIVGGNSSEAFAVAALRGDGKPDPSFGGGDGRVVTAGPTDLRPSDMVVDSAGRIVVGGSVGTPGGPGTPTGPGTFVLARYLPDGTPDNTFDGDGMVATVSSSLGGLGGLAAAPGGKVVAAGSFVSASAYLDRQMTVVRYNEDGSLDASFSGDGIATVGFVYTFGAPRDDVASAVAVDPSDGAVILAGISTAITTTPWRQQSALVRLTSAGALEAGFTGDGSDLGRDGWFNALALLPSGAVFAAGSTPFGHADILLSKYGRTGRDTTFGSGDPVTGGSVTTDLPGPVDNVGRAVAVQADGKVLVAGESGPGGDVLDFAISRVNADGTPDLGFGGGTGYVVFNSPGADHLTALAIQGDGKILAAGYTSVSTGGGIDNRSLLLVRYLPNGTLDPSFGGGTGRAMIPQGESQGVYATSMALQPDGKIVVAGAQYYVGTFAVLRFDPSGAPDPTFGGGDGAVVTRFQGADTYFSARAVVIDAAGRIVVAGGYSAAAVARYDAAGNLDPTFDGDGFATFEFSPTASATGFATALGLDASNRIVVAGLSSEATGFNQGDFGVARLRDDGSLDPAFGTGGRTVTDFAGFTDLANAVVVLADGSAIVAGESYPGTPGSKFDFALAKYTPAGVLDTSFGSGGKVTTDFGGRDEVYALALDGPDHVVAAGVSDPSNSVPAGDFAIARYSLTAAAAPRVRQVSVSGAAWQPAFRNYLRDAGLSQNASGFAVGTTAGGPLPWVNLDQVSVTFDQPVQVEQSALRVRGLNGADYALDPAAFSYDAAGRTATWKLANGATFGTDRIRLELDGDAVHSGTRSLDGGDYVARFNSLPGDATRDGTVLADDYSAVKKKFFATPADSGTGDAAYGVFYDVNGSGAILANDFSEVKKRFFQTLPPEQTAAAPLTVRRVTEGVL